MIKLKFLPLICLIPLVIHGCTNISHGPPLRYGKKPVLMASPEYVLAIHPLHNPTKLIETYQPLIDYLNSNIKDVHISLEASRNYATFEEKYERRKPNLLLPNPWQTTQAIKRGYHVICMAGDPQDFKGIFIVRKDGHIKRPLDLKGKAVSYPAPTALAACIMPQYYLYKNGIDINHDIENRYVGSQESSIMNVYIGETSAGATWPPPWRAFQSDHPNEAAKLKVIWETEPLINNSVMVRDDVPANIKDQIQKLLSSLYNTKEGETILSNIETSRFIPATDNDYNVVNTYVGRFEKQVRLVKQK